MVSNVVYVVLISLRCCREWGKRNDLRGRALGVTKWSVRRLHRLRPTPRPTGVEDMGLKEEAQRNTNSTAEVQMSPVNPHFIPSDRRARANTALNETNTTTNTNTPSDSANATAAAGDQDLANQQTRSRQPRLRRAHTRHISDDGHEFFVDVASQRSVWKLPDDGVVVAEDAAVAL